MMMLMIVMCFVVNTGFIITLLMDLQSITVDVMLDDEK